VKTGTGRFPTHSVLKAPAGQGRNSAMADDLTRGLVAGTASAAAPQIVHNTNFAPELFDVR
jgi:hypothetical protein